MKRILGFLWMGVMLAGAAPWVSAQETGVSISIRATIYRGQNDEVPDALAELPALKKSLVRLFGYPHYEILGTADSHLPQGTEVTLKPTKCMTFSMMPQNAQTNRYPYRFFVQEKEHFHGEFEPKPQVPLIIKGPQHGKGLLILVVTSTSGGAKSSAP